MNVRAQRSRLAVCVLAALCLGSQLASVLHFTLVRHARCVEHGELVHAGSPGLEHVAAPGQRHSRLASAYEAASQSSTEPAHDEHCITCGERRLHVGPTEATSVREPGLERIRGPALQKAIDPLARERWLLAPKSSPPA